MEALSSTCFGGVQRLRPPAANRPPSLCLRRLVAVIVAVIATIGLPTSGPTQDADAVETSAGVDFFERQVRPLLAERCYDCHGAETAESGLRLDIADRLFQGGNAGPAVAPGKPDQSLLIQLVRGEGELQMPPDEPLAAHEIAILEQWVRDGAIWPDYLGPQLNTPVAHDPLRAEFSDAQRSYWAFQSLSDPRVPAASSAGDEPTAIDRFLLAKLTTTGLHFAPKAAKRTLLRRVAFDLTGLPPTPAEIEEFLADDSPEALDVVVDRLLASRHYGERWGKHWLDVARYGESAAHDGNNAYLHAWRYRDYVIKAFNDDKPYDQFIIEQLAGDLLPQTEDPQRNYDQIAATGFLQVGPKPVVMRDKRQMLLDIVDEQILATGAAFLGLTVACARCHDHKFDPIPTADYYSLAGIFASTHVMADDLPDSKWIEKEIASPDGQPVKIMTVEDFPEPKNLPIHRRGNYRLLGPEAPRGFLQIIAGTTRQPLGNQGSGRLELAHWIASPRNPLTARVMVNRIWQHHFGRGLVATSDNFGSQGGRPTHPELLDWLACRFIESGWSVKAMHRLMLRTHAYQQAYLESTEAQAVDAENELLWRMRRRRLSAEEVRDAILAVSGQLDVSLGGTLFTEGYTANDPARELFVVDISGKERFPPFEVPRRSVYLPVIRNGRPQVLTLFDVANAHEPTGVRGETTVPSQSLFLLNSAFARSQSEAFAVRLADASAPSEDSTLRIRRAYELALGRPPTDSELQQASRFLANYEIAASELGTSLMAQSEEPTKSDEDYERMVRSHDQLTAYHRLRGIELNGVDQRLELVSAEAFRSIRDALTVECLVKPADVRNYMMIVGRDGAQERLWKLGVYGVEMGGVRHNVLFSEFFSSSLGGIRVHNQPPAIAPLGEWTHVALTYGNNRRRFYLNGKLLDDVAVSGSVPTGSLPLSIGSRLDDTEWFRGAIDHVAVYKADIGQATIRSHCRALRIVDGTNMSPVESMAWRALCQSLFCLNEFIYVE